MDYFDCDYFDQAYFDTDCAPAGSSHGRLLRRRPRVVLPEPEPPDRDDDLLAII